MSGSDRHGTVHGTVPFTSHPMIIILRLETCRRAEGCGLWGVWDLGGYLKSDDVVRER